MKVIIDTNILISAALRGGKPNMIIASIIGDLRFEWIASHPTNLMRSPVK